MRAVVQRVRSCSVTVEGQVVGAIQHGLLVLLGVTHTDTLQDVEYLADKLVGLRIFSDDAGKMNLGLQEVNGAMLVVSQFTLYGDCRKGRRPAFTDAALPVLAKPLYEQFCDHVRQLGIIVETGIFAADMQVELINDGPVTLIVESRKI